MLDLGLAGVCWRKGHWANIFNTILNIGRTTQVKVCNVSLTGHDAFDQMRWVAPGKGHKGYVGQHS